MDSKLDQAREYAQWMIDNTPRHHQSKARAAAEVIQSLPDRIVDGDKLREVITDWGNREVTSDAYTLYRQVLALLPTPPLPTLADMNEADRHALIDKDVKVEGWNSPSRLIAVHKDEGAVLGHNWINPWPFVEVRPLSELTPADATPDQQVNSSESPKGSLPRPEDVPSGEAWLVLRDGHKWVAARESSEKATWPWSLARLDGADYGMARDSAITLVSRLVPERKENA